MTRFDLIDEPWLPCLAPDGAAVEVGLEHALLRAHEWRELSDPSPLVTVALHRLLLAVLHRALAGPPNTEAWREIWNAGRFPPERIGGYLGTWRRRFDLFDPERPFFQAPPGVFDGAKPPDPVTRLAQEAAAGNNATLFDHAADGQPGPVAAAEAARRLVAMQAFPIGFGKSTPFYLKDGPLTRGYSVLAVGSSLFETLMLNLLPAGVAASIVPTAGDGRPHWEQDVLPTPDERGTEPTGYADVLAWPSRSIRLVPAGDGTLVAGCRLQQNLKLRDGVFDPFKAYRLDKQQGWRPRGFRPEKALWRDSTALFARHGRNGSGQRPPELMEWLARVDDERIDGAIDARPVYALAAFGMATDEGKAASVLLWRREHLPLPLALLGEEGAEEAIARAVALAEAAGRHLGWAATRLALLLAEPGAERAANDQPGKKPSKDQMDRARALAGTLGLERRFWPRLDAAFAGFLTRLPADRAHDERADAVVFGTRELPAWRAVVEEAARRAFDEGTGGLARSARSLRAVTEARRAFGGGLAAALDTAGGDRTEGGDE